jgi:hypothetical protein
MTNGLLLGEPADPELRDRLEHLAATLPELYGTVDPSCLDRITERTGNRGTARSTPHQKKGSGRHLPMNSARKVSNPGFMARSASCTRCTASGS